MFGEEPAEGFRGEEVAEVEQNALAAGDADFAAADGNVQRDLHVSPGRWRNVEVVRVFR